MVPGKTEKTNGGFSYQILGGGRRHRFSIRYHRVGKAHRVYSRIAGDLEEEKKVEIVVTGTRRTSVDGLGKWTPQLREE